jgi:hypothetical protein
MGLFYWGEENNPAYQVPDDAPPVQRLRVDKLTHGHTPDKGRAPTRGHENDPIQIRYGLFGGMRVVDGNARLAAARERGDEWIDAQVYE